MNEEETEAKVRFYTSLADLLELIYRKIDENELWIHIYVEKEE